MAYNHDIAFESALLFVENNPEFFDFTIGKPRTAYSEVYWWSEFPDRKSDALRLSLRCTVYTSSVPDVVCDLYRRYAKYIESDEALVVVERVFNSEECHVWVETR